MTIIIFIIFFWSKSRAENEPLQSLKFKVWLKVGSKRFQALKFKILLSDIMYQLTNTFITINY